MEQRKNSKLSVPKFQLLQYFKSLVPGVTSSCRLFAWCKGSHDKDKKRYGAAITVCQQQAGIRVQVIRAHSLE